jgi:SAM-dependent methyltransferase
VNWQIGDTTRYITRYDFGAKQFDLWHDRAVFHFLTDLDAPATYINTPRRSVKPGGHVLIATFGPEGPLQCSGLEVVRYSQTQLQQVLGDGFKLLGSELTTHLTPMGSEQQFLYGWFEVVRSYRGGPFELDVDAWFVQSTNSSGTHFFLKPDLDQ